MEIKQFDVYFVNLDPIVGSEIKKSRPCLIISPNDINQVLNTVIVAPLTSTLRNYPTRVDCTVNAKKGQIALDQLRAIDKIRLLRKLDNLNKKTSHSVLENLQELFS